MSRDFSLLGRLREALRDGDRLEDLTVYYVPCVIWDDYEDYRDRQHRGYGHALTPDQGAIRSGPASTIPGGAKAWYQNEDGTWGTEVAMAFSARYIYVAATYDGGDWFEAIPRHPEGVTFIPRLGGG